MPAYLDFAGHDEVQHELLTILLSIVGILQAQNACFAVFMLFKALIQAFAKWRKSPLTLEAQSYSKVPCCFGHPVVDTPASLMIASSSWVSFLFLTAVLHAPMTVTNQISKHVVYLQPTCTEWYAS